MRSSPPSILVLLFLAASALSAGPWIRDAHEPGVLSLSPFRRDRLVSTGGLVIGPDGSLTMRKVNGRYGPRGGFITPILTPGQAIEVLQIGYDAAIPEGCSLSIEARLYARGSAQPGNWQGLQPEEELPIGAGQDRVQLRVVLSSNGFEAPVLTALSLSQAGKDTLPDLPGVRVSLSGPAVVPRQRWGAAAPRRPHCKLSAGKIVIHHSSEPRAARYAGSATIRAIQSFHMYTRGWNDIAYHYVIAPDGTIFQGRPEWANGSHSPPNGRKLGICVLGNFNRGVEKVSAKARASLVKLVAHLAGKHGISSQAIYGHRDFNSTDCPGDRLHASLGHLRRQVDRMLHKGPRA